MFSTGMSYDDAQHVATVISTHRSKSIILPVYKLSRPGKGLTMVLRNNFYNWKMSVISEKPIEADFSGLFHTTPPIEPAYTGNELASCYFEGFPPEYIFGYYEAGDKKKWSAEIWSNHALWTAMFILLRSIDIVKPMVWHTEASHKKELAERG
jgi:hypothetical protein